MDGRKRQCLSLSPNGNFGPEEAFCPRVFDGYLCWLATRAGELAVQACPHARISESISSTVPKATKQCELNGTWYTHPVKNVPWSNYTECNLTLFSNDTAIVDIFLNINADYSLMFYRWLPIMKVIAYYGYWISIATLLICISILISIKKLHCARNVLHIHLFTSFIFRAITFLIKESTLNGGVAPSSDVVKTESGEQYITENVSWLCKAVTTIWVYFTQANHIFILMEGIYLHNLMFMNLFSENSSVRLYYLFGWGIPFCFISLWAILRLLYDDNICWTLFANKYIAWLQQIPIDLSAIINFFLFISITRILCIKINSMYVQHNKIKYRRLIRSTLTLLLIYAVPYAISVSVLFISSYYEEYTIEFIWIFYDQIFTAFQGLLMGLIYCLLNGEVKSEIMQKIYAIQRYQQHAKQARASRTISNTMQFTIPIQDELDARRNAGNYYTTSDL